MWIALLTLALPTSTLPPLRACDNATVRDAAFQTPRDVHRLCVVHRHGDRAAMDRVAALRDWLAESAAGLNIEVVSVDADASDVAWSAYALPSAPPTLPVVVLVGWRTADRKSFFIDHWEPGLNAEELDAIRTSPARRAIRDAVGNHLAVLLYIPGTGADAGRAEGVIDLVVRERNEQGPLGLSVVRVERTDPRERLLLSFVGVQAEGSDWVGIVFGAGKFMPPLIGEAITADALNGRLATISAACTCLQSPARLGVDIPMVWRKTWSDSVTLLATGGTSQEEPRAENARGMPPIAMPANAALPAGVAVDAAAAERRLWIIAAGTLVGLVLLSTVALLWQRRGSRDA